MQTLSSAMRTCIASASAVECTATDLIPISRQARITRSAISPRLAIRILSNIGASPPYSMIIRGAPYSTGLPSSTRMRLTVPARGAGMWFIVFIASMIRTVWPSATCAPTVDKGRRTRFGRQIDRARPWAR